MKFTDITASLRRTVTSLAYKLCIDMLFSPFNACILRIIWYKLVSLDMQVKFDEEVRYHRACMKNVQVKSPYFFSELAEYIL